jgi:hypothetical protein
MKTVLLYFFGAFAIFTAIGYQMGVKSASDPYTTAMYIANRTEVELTGQSIVMRFRGKASQPYWTYDLNQNSARFAATKTLLTSMRPKSLSAQSETLLGFVGGGTVLAVSAKDVAYSIMKGKHEGDWRNTLATVVGGATGFALGYKLGFSSIDFDSPEVLARLRDKKSVETIKKLVFASMMAKQQLVIPESNSPKFAIVCGPTISKVACVLSNANLSDEQQRAQLRKSLFTSANEKMSADDGVLEGYEFMAFFI